MKKLLSVLIALTIALGVIMTPASASAQSVIKKSLMQYTDQNLTFEKGENDQYECKVENNDKGYIKVSSGNEGVWYLLTVYAEKATESAKPKITVTDTKDGSVVKSFEITVTPAKKVKMKDIKLNVKSSKLIKIDNPYNKNYKLKYNKKILKITRYLSSSGYEMHTVKGLKKGTTTVKAIIKGKVYGSFKVTVGDFKSSIKASYKKSSIKYNKHIKSYNFFEGGVIDICDAVKHFHMDGNYTVKIKNKKIAAAMKLKKDATKPNRVMLYSLKTGKTDVAVYEKRGKAKKRKVGTIALTVKRAKDREVVETNMMNDNDGIFYEFFICPGDRVNLKDIVVKRYVNGYCTDVKFKESEYSFTFAAEPADTLTVDEDGIFTCLGFGSQGGNNRASYTITFSDGSTIGGSGSFDIVDEDFF